MGPDPLYLSGAEETDRTVMKSKHRLRRISESGDPHADFARLSELLSGWYGHILIMDFKRDTGAVPNGEAFFNRMEH